MPEYCTFTLNLSQNQKEIFSVRYVPNTGPDRICALHGGKVHQRRDGIANPRFSRNPRPRDLDGDETKYRKTTVWSNYSGCSSRNAIFSGRRNDTGVITVHDETVGEWIVKLVCNPSRFSPRRKIGGEGSTTVSPKDADDPPLPPSPPSNTREPEGASPNFRSFSRRTSRRRSRTFALPGFTLSSSNPLHARRGRVRTRL